MVLFFTHSHFVMTCAWVAFLVLELEFFIKGNSELCPGLQGKKKRQHSGPILGACTVFSVLLCDGQLVWPQEKTWDRLKTTVYYSHRS